MKLLLVAVLIGLVAKSYAGNCAGVEQKLEMGNVDPVGFYKLKAWPKDSFDEPWKAVEGAGGIEIYDSDCLSIKPKKKATLQRVCVSVKKTQKIDMYYIKGGEKHHPSSDAIEIVDAGDEFDDTCWVLRNDKPKEPKNVKQIRICSDGPMATGQPIKMKDVKVTMCVE